MQNLVLFVRVAGSTLLVADQYISLKKEIKMNYEEGPEAPERQSQVDERSFN